MALSALGTRTARRVLLDAIGGVESGREAVASALEQLLSDRAGEVGPDFRYRHVSAVSIGDSALDVSIGGAKTSVPTEVRGAGGDSALHAPRQGAVGLKAGRRLIELPGRPGVSSLAFNPAGNLLAIGRADGELSVWWTAHPSKNPVPTAIRRNVKTGTAMMEIGVCLTPPFHPPFHRHFTALSPPCHSPFTAIS